MRWPQGSTPAPCTQCHHAVRSSRTSRAWSAPTGTHRVLDYAAQLGYSVRTLTRASQAAVGVGAKRFIDDRILLEAKRLLIHTDLTAASVGQRLGFPRATTFTK
ncbi:MAG TPA: helix-turn-helix domain-containing protein, partial [Kutzneria sp.]|nr:helix-turn-helix domain-containing protein [Kutzneria sp.]